VSVGYGFIYSLLVDGLIFGFSAIGIAVVIGWGRLADLTPDASFTTGAVGLWCSVGHGNLWGPVVGFLFGALTGSLTAMIVLMGVSPLLASLVVLGLAYSISWMILGNPLMTLDINQALLATLSSFNQLLFVVLTTLFVLIVINLFVSTELGLKLRAVSENSYSVPTGSISLGLATSAWLAIGNGLVGLSGALFASKTFIVEINMGNGTLISGLSAFLFGWAILGFREGVRSRLWGALIGAILLNLLLGVALIAGAPGQFFRAITALALLGCLLVASRASRNVFSGLRL
jgi:putative ABC transport system permease protein